LNELKADQTTCALGNLREVIATQTTLLNNDFDITGRPELCSSRQLAQRLIQAESNGQSTSLTNPAPQLKLHRFRLKSDRGTFPEVVKLALPLELFVIPVQDRICLDGGISTGFFYRLLHCWAKKVYGIDVGYGQVDWRLRNDPRVLRERTTYAISSQPVV